MIGILRVERGNISSQRILLPLAYIETARVGQGALKKIQVAVTGSAAWPAPLSVHGEVAVGFIAVVEIELVPDKLSADIDLMLALYPDHVVGKVDRYVVRSEEHT